MIVIGLLLLVLIVFVAGNWVGYHFGYNAGVLADVQCHIQNNRKG